MKKFLFTDAMHNVVEVQSQEELETLIESADQKDTIRIWLFNSNEWINYAAFRKQFPVISRKERSIAISSKTLLVNNDVQQIINRPVNKTPWFKKILFLTGITAGVILVFNFTKLKWEKAAPVKTIVTRPVNVPVMDIDSLIYQIEDSRGKSLDKYTKNNLRLRNTWPDRILLELAADKEINGTDSRFSNVKISIDNTTGFNLDNAVVRLFVWKKNKASLVDTIHFNTVGYDKLSKREMEFRYRGDSISLSFETIKAKSFNFCYSAATKNNSGNYNDRWFCRE